MHGPEKTRSSKQLLPNRNDTKVSTGQLVPLPKILRPPDHRTDNQRASNDTSRILSTLKLSVLNFELLLKLVGGRDNFRNNPIRHFLWWRRDLGRVPEQNWLLPSRQPATPLLHLHWKMAWCPHSIGNHAGGLRGHSDRQRHLLFRFQHSLSALGVATLLTVVLDRGSWLHVLLQFPVQEHVNVNTGDCYSLPLCI